MTCPICDKETAPEYRPFCSRRCADVDLGRWRKGSYAIPVDETEDENDLSGDDAPGPHQRH